MSVKKIISILSLLVLSLSVYGQSARQQVKTLFVKGEYGDAAVLCYGAAATAGQSDKDYFYSLAKKCENCENLRKQGAKQYSSGDYAGAATSYRKLLALNASDAVAKSRIDECDRKVAAAEAKANALAAAKAAEDAIWQKAVSAGTEEAYNEYLANSTLKSHVTEAKGRIAQIEERRNAVREEQRKASERNASSSNNYASNSTSATGTYNHSTTTTKSTGSTRSTKSTTSTSTSYSTHAPATPTSRPSSTHYRSTPSIGLGLNIGMDMDFALDVHSLTLPRVEFSVGGYENVFNFAIGAQYRRYSGSNHSTDRFDIGDPPDFVGDLHPHLVTNQICFPATARFNIATRSSEFGYFVAAGASFNLALSSYYQRYVSDKNSEKITIDGLTLANKFNVSSFAKAGVCCKYLDFGLFVRYDISPVYDKAAVASDVILNDSYDFNFYNNYEAIRNQVDKRLFFGFTMTMTVVLKD